MTATPNKTDAGNGSYGICRVIDASRSPSPDPATFAQPPAPLVIQKPRYLLASVLLWGVFFCLMLFDDYDGIMSWIGAPFVATVLLAISLSITLVLGLSRRIPWFAGIWYSGRALAACVLISSILVLVFGHSLGMREAYTYTNSLGDTVTATRLHSFVSLPAFFLASFSVLYWPAAKAIIRDS